MHLEEMLTFIIDENRYFRGKYKKGVDDFVKKKNYKCLLYTQVLRHSLLTNKMLPCVLMYVMEAR